MPQVTTTLPTGVRVFNSVTLPAGQETDLVSILAGDGGQLTLEQLDGTASGATKLRVYSVVRGVRSQVAEVDVSGQFLHKFEGGVITQPDDFVPNPLPFAQAVSFGLVGSGGIVVTGQNTAGGTIQIGATADRRIDGPFEVA